MNIRKQRLGTMSKTSFYRNMLELAKNRAGMYLREAALPNIQGILLPRILLLALFASWP
jgi:hypothetical protein